MSWEFWVEGIVDNIPVWLNKSAYGAWLPFKALFDLDLKALAGSIANSISGELSWLSERNFFSSTYALAYLACTTLLLDSTLWETSEEEGLVYFLMAFVLEETGSYLLKWIS